MISKHIKRFENAQTVMSELTYQLTEFHTKVGGDVGKISALFSDLTPEPQVVHSATDSNPLTMCGRRRRRRRWDERERVS